MAKASDYELSVDRGHGLKPQPTAGKRTPKIPELDNRVVYEAEFNEGAKQYFIAGAKRIGFKVTDVAPEMTDVPLSTRVARSNAAKADLHISFHYNALDDEWREGVGGIETLAGSSSTSKKIAAKVQAQLIKATGLRDRGVKDGSWLYLNHTKCPLVLVECGFMDIKAEALLMLNKSHQKNCAEAVLKGICKHFGVKYVEEKKQETKPAASKPAAKPSKPEAKPTKDVPGTGDFIHRVIVDGKQKGAFGKAAGVATTVEEAVKAGAKEIKIERVK